MIPTAEKGKGVYLLIRLLVQPHPLEVVMYLLYDRLSPHRSGIPTPPSSSLTLPSPLIMIEQSIFYVRPCLRQLKQTAL
jgi:hypothetical protein